MPKNKFKVGDEVIRTGTYDLGPADIIIAKIAGVWEEIQVGFKAKVVSIPGMKVYDDQGFTNSKEGFCLDWKGRREDDTGWANQNHFELATKTKKNATKK